MKILCLSPYHGGSHRSFFESFCAASCHDVHIVSLEPRHFKWRMRSGALEIVAKAREAGVFQQSWDLIFTSTLMNLAELRAFLPRELRSTPIVAYFHENQVSYPTREYQERDNHFAITNWLSAQAADRCIFNSRFNLNSFLNGTQQLLRKMPERIKGSSLSTIEAKSCVVYPGIDSEFFSAVPLKKETTLRPVLGWCGRWEHDKNPLGFFETLERLEQNNFDFSLIFLGQSFRSIPPEIAAGLKRHQGRILHAGFAESREEYRKLLQQMDYCVSSARHEFFGLALLEAASAGAQPVAPDRLVYPELYPKPYLYPDTKSGLFDYLALRLPQNGKQERLNPVASSSAQATAQRYNLPQMCADLDRELERPFDS